MNKTTPYSTEIQYKVWNNEKQRFIEIAPDVDGLGHVEVSYLHSGIVERITMPPEMALLVAEAIKKVAEHIITNE